jgi:hypothetical protein
MRTTIQDLVWALVSISNKSAHHELKGGYHTAWGAPFLVKFSKNGREYHYDSGSMMTCDVTWWWKYARISGETTHFG